MNRIYSLFALAAVFCLFALACTKSEIAPVDEISGQEVEQSDYISPDNFHLVEMEFGASADEEEAGQNAPKNASGASTKCTGKGLTFSLFEDSLDDEAESTRTALDGTGKITWNEGDGLKVYYYNGTSNYTEATIKHGGDNYSTLTARVNDSDKYYYAFYPYSGFTTTVTYEGDATYGNGAIQVTIPSTQTVTLTEGTTNNFASCHMAVGKGSKDTQQFVFSNVGSYLKFDVTNTTATAITLQSSNGENLVGTFTVPFTDAAGTIGTPIINSGSSSVTVNLPEGRTGTITVYVPLLPGAVVSGFRIRYEYSGGAVHPGYANAKRSNGDRVNRTFARRRVLNVGTLDTRIHENWYVVTSGSGSYDDIDDVLHPEAGSDWSHPLNLTGLDDLLSQKLDGNGSQINLDTYDRAWVLDGSTIHMAGGTYSLPATGTAEGFKVEYNNYGRQVKINLIGNYNVGASTPDSTNYHTILTPAVSGKCALVFGNQTEVSINNVTFSGARLSAQSTTALKVAAGNSGDATAHLSSCLFTDNQESSSYHGAACAIFKGTADFTKCTFSGNSGYTGSALVLEAYAGDVSLTKCKFNGNSGTEYGGAIACLGAGRTCSLTDCLIYDNHARMGGVVYLYAGTLAFAQCGVYANYAQPASGADYGGGVIFMKNGDDSSRGIGTLTVNNCMFEGNYCKNNQSQWGGVLYVDNCKCNQTFTNTVFKNNYTSFKGGVIYMYGPSFLKLNGCLFQGNHTRTHGIILGENTNLIYMNRVTFKENYLTVKPENNMNGWGVNLHTATAVICMHNVTSYGNYQSNTGYQQQSFNSDGSMLVTCSTIIDNMTKALLRANGGSSHYFTICDNILINTNTPGEIVAPSDAIKNASHGYNDGYNVVSAGSFYNMTTQSTDKISKSVSDLGGSYSESLSWKTGNYFTIYGVYAWPQAKFNALSFTSPVTTNVTTAMGTNFPVACPECGLDGSEWAKQVGPDFYKWLEGMGVSGFRAAYHVDGRYEYRGDNPWWPGAYQGNVNPL